MQWGRAHEKRPCELGMFIENTEDLKKLDEILCCSSIKYPELKYKEECEIIV